MFNKKHAHAVFSWNVIVFRPSEMCTRSLRLWICPYKCKEKVSGQTPPFSFMGVLNVCANATAIEECRHVCDQIFQCGWSQIVFVGSMYGKHWSMEDVWRVLQ
jgi:hypothetical protein